MGSPAGLQEALSGKRFALVIADDKIDGNWFMWPGLLNNYHVVEEIQGPHVVTGAPTTPRYVLQPTLPPPVIDKDREP
jgi:hypothetical protein